MSDRELPCGRVCGRTPSVNGHSPEFVEDRIRRRAGQHNLPSVRTGFWEDAPAALKEALPADFVNPVLYSIPDCGGMATVLGANEIAAGDGTGLVRIVLDEIAEISFPCTAEQKKRDAFDILR